MLNALKNIGKYVGKLVLTQLGVSTGNGAAGSATAIAPGDTLTTILQKVAEMQLAGVRANLDGTTKRILVAAVVEQVLLEYFHSRGMKLKTGHAYQAQVEALVGNLFNLWDDFEADIKTVDVGSTTTATIAPATTAPAAPPAQG